MRFAAESTNSKRGSARVNQDYTYSNLKFEPINLKLKK